MAYPTKDSFTFDHTAQGTYPGWTPEESKANLNKRSEEMRVALNALVAALNSTGDDNWLYKQIANAILDQVADASLTDVKLSNEAGQIKARFTAHTSENVHGLKLGIPAINDDLDQCLTDGVYAFTPTTLNIPISDSGVIEVFVSNGITHDNTLNWIWQRASIANSTVMFFRRKLQGGPWSVWEKVLTESDKPANGTYTGDGTAERTIVLGFRPKSVLILQDGYDMFTPANGSTPGYIQGGLAFDGTPLLTGTVSVIEIVDTGFKVYYTTVASENNYYAYTNHLSTQYRYTANR